MGIKELLRLIKKVSLFMLSLQERALTMQLSLFLNKNKKYLTPRGCSFSLVSDEKAKKEKLNTEIKNILKKYKNDKEAIIDFIVKNKTKVFKIKDANKMLDVIGEEKGLISAHTGYKALYLNYLLYRKISLKSDPVFVIEDGEVDIYYLIQQFHRWYFMKNNFNGFDEKSQELLRQVNKGNEDRIISKLKPEEITGLQKAIARDVESITFVTNYARETSGAKGALQKITSGVGASI